MSRSKRGQTFTSWEAKRAVGQFTKITNDMMKSEAWKALTLQQQGLYLHLKAKYLPKVDHGMIISSNVADISCPDSEWKPLYKSNYRAFKKDINALIEHGFIRVVANRRHLRQCTLFGLDCEGWKTLA